MARMTKAQKEEQRDAIERLRKILKPGDTVYCVLRSVSRSGMSRVIDFYHIDSSGTMWLSGLMAKALDMTRTSSGQAEGLKVRGCGMDMGFHVVYSLGRTLFPDGFGIRPAEGPHGAIPANTEANRPTSQDDADSMRLAGWKFWGRNGDESGWDNDGGYALTHRWL